MTALGLSHAGLAHAEGSGAGKGAVITTAAPEGFSSLGENQEAIVDVFFGGKRVGDARVTFRPGKLTFENPAAVAALIGDVKEPTSVQAALSTGNLATHADLACTVGADPLSCGRLDPETAGIVFDEDRLRVEIFVNARLLAVHAPTQKQYLPAPSGGLTFIDSLGGVLSGATGGTQAYNLRNRLVAGDGNRRMRLDFAYASGFGLQIDRAIGEIDRRGWRAMAGAFWAPGTDLIGRQKLLGVGIETQTDTRADKDQIRGDPLIVFLAQRSRVDIVREGRILASRIYDAGNQALDTTALPDGSYEIVLRIEEAGGARREERRFFSKNPVVPALGQKIAYAYAGLLADDTRRGILNLTRKPFVQVGGAMRIDRRVALDGNVVLVDNVAVGQLGANLILGFAQLRFAGYLSTDGASGATARMSTTGDAKLNFYLDARYVSKEITGPLTGWSSDPSVPAPVPGASANPSARIQLSGNISYSLPAVQAMLSGTYSKQRAQAATYNIGPSLRMDLIQKGNFRLSASATYAMTECGRVGFAGLTMQIVGRKASLAATAGLRVVEEKPAATRTEPVGSLYGTWQDENLLGGEVQLAGGVEREVDRSLATGAIEYRSRVANLRADLVRNLGGSGSEMQYSIGFDTTLAAGGGTVTLRGKQTADSMVVLAIRSPLPGSKFDVLVNDSPAAEVRSGELLTLPLTAYRRYAIRIQPRDGALLQYDSSERTVSLYPGSVVKLDWSANPVIAMFGRIVDERGRPMANAMLSAPGSTAQTDDNGYFEIEMAAGSTFRVNATGGRVCVIAPPTVPVDQGYGRLGTLRCLAGRLVEK